MSNKFQVEFSYNPNQNGRQDQLMLRPLKNFMFEPVGVEKDDDYRCVTVGIKSDVAGGVHIVNALQEAVRLLNEKNVKLTSYVYVMGTNLEITVPATVDQTGVMKLKDLVNKATEEKVDVNNFNNGYTVVFKEVAKFNEFKESHKDEFKALQDKGVVFVENEHREELHCVTSYTQKNKQGVAFGKV